MFPVPERSEVSLTVLKKDVGDWSEDEVRALRSLTPVIYRYRPEPKYLVLLGAIPEEQIGECLIVPPEVNVSITHTVGKDNLEAPFVLA
jgi:hypothetical protein